MAFSVAVDATPAEVEQLSSVERAPKQHAHAPSADACLINVRRESSVIEVLRLCGSKIKTVSSLGELS